MTRRNNRFKYEPVDDVASSSDESFKTEEKPFKLRREISIFSGVCLVVSMMIGSGIFVVPTGVLKYCNGDVRTSMAIWGVGGIIAMIAALCVAELGASIPESGSWMTYIHYAFGPFPSFLFTWMVVISANPESLAAQIIALGEYMTKLYFRDGCEVPHSALLKKLLGVSVAMIIMGINITRVKLAVRLQIFFAFGKVVALVGIAVAGFLRLIQDRSVATANFFPEMSNITASASSSGIDVERATSGGIGVSGLSLALYQGLWAYDGFEAITLVTEEVKNPARSLPIITCIAVPVVTLLYFIVNIAYFSVLTPSEMLSSHAVAVTFGQKIHPFVAYLMTLSVCMSLIGSLNLCFLAIARLPFIAGRLGHMPEFLSMAHIHYYSPVPAILLTLILGMSMLFSSNFDVLVTACLFTNWIFRGLTFVGLLHLRNKRKDLKRPYRVYKVTAIIATLISMYLMVVPLIYQPEPLYLLSLVLFVIFIGMYRLVSLGKIHMTGIGRTGRFLQKLLLVAPTCKDIYK